MLTQDMVINHLWKIGRASEPGLMKQVMDSFEANKSNPLDKVPAQVKLQTKRPEVKRGIEDIFQSFYVAPNAEEVYTLEIRGVAKPIDGRLYAAMKALLQMGVTPNEDIATACRNIFTYFAQVADSYVDTATIVKDMPKDTPEEKKIKSVLKELWGV